MKLRPRLSLLNLLLLTAIVAQPRRGDKILAQGEALGSEGATRNKP